MANRRVGTHALTSDNLRRSRLNSVMVSEVPRKIAANTRQVVMVPHVLSSIAANEILTTCKDGYGMILEKGCGSITAGETSFEMPGKGQRHESSGVASNTRAGQA